jgi:hypothetical protein
MIESVPPLPRFGEDEVDAELAALPAPSRTRGLTGMALMVSVMVLSAGLMVVHRGDLQYLLATRVAKDLGDARQISVGSLSENEYASLQGMPLAARAVRFRRLGSSGIYRVYPLADQTRIFVERFTEDAATGRSRPHGEYTGRMMRMSHAGSAYKSVRATLEQQMGNPVPDDAWVLIDGEAPGDRYWTVAMYAMLALFFLFNTVTLVRHGRPVRDDD